MTICRAEQLHVTFCDLPEPDTIGVVISKSFEFSRIDKDDIRLIENSEGPLGRFEIVDLVVELLELRGVLQ